MNEYIRTEGLSFTYKDSSDVKNPPPAVNNVSIGINEGEYVAILGHNGSGKSTFAKLLNLILVATDGYLYIDGREIDSDKITDDEIFEVRKNIGMVFQNPDNQLVATLVDEDVAFGPENLGLPREEIIKRVNESLACVGMTEFADRSPAHLSGGQKQRVAIAGVIAMKPKFIIFDESTAMLDPIGRKDVIATMEKLNREENIAVINITHYMNEAARADRVIVINDGEVVMDASPKEVFSQVEKIRALGLETPQSTELLYMLNQSGYNFPLDCIDPDECVRVLKDFLDK